MSPKALGRGPHSQLSGASRSWLPTAMPAPGFSASFVEVSLHLLAEVSVLGEEERGKGGNDMKIRKSSDEKEFECPSTGEWISKHGASTDN